MAVTSQKDGVITLDAAGDLSANQYEIMKCSANDTATVVGGETEIAIGVLLNKPDAAGKAARIQYAGIAEVLAGGNVTVGNRVMPDATGRVVNVDADGKTVVGVALTGTGTAGERIKVLLTIGAQQAS